MLILRRFSNLNSMLGVTAYVLRFVTAYVLRFVKKTMN